MNIPKIVFHNSKRNMYRLDVWMFEKFEKKQLGDKKNEQGIEKLGTI